MCYIDSHKTKYQEKFWTKFERSGILEWYTSFIIFLLAFSSSSDFMTAFRIQENLAQKELVNIFLD